MGMLRPFDAVLFDLDGTLTDNMRVHEDSFVRLPRRM